MARAPEQAICKIDKRPTMRHHKTDHHADSSSPYLLRACASVCIERLREATW